MTNTQADDTVHDVRVLAQYYPYLDMLEPRDPGKDPRLPYQLVFYYRNRRDLDTTWGNVTVSRNRYRFSKDLEAHRSAMYEKYPSKIANKGDHANLCPRVARYDDASGATRPPVPHLSLELATYADQIGTNMYPDATFSKPIHDELTGTDALNVRQWDQGRAGNPGRLPEFPASGLANTLGVAIGILAKSATGEQLICWRRRSDKARTYTSHRTYR